MTTPLPFDPLAEARRQWLARWPDHADHMAAVTSIMRAQQVLLTRIERALKPHGLTFASYEALVLLSFTKTGALPMGKIGERLMVHPTSATNTIDRLEHKGLVRRRPAPEDRRRILAEITPEGRELAEKTTRELNSLNFTLDALPGDQAVELARLLRTVRVAVGDIAAEAHDPWSPKIG